MEHDDQESYVMNLSYVLQQCPEHWQKFINHVSSSWLNGQHSAKIKEVIDRELIEYGARYYEGPYDMGGPNVIFDKASDASRFILIWS